MSAEQGNWYWLIYSSLLLSVLFIQIFMHFLPQCTSSPLKVYSTKYLAITIFKLSIYGVRLLDDLGKLCLTSFFLLLLFWNKVLFEVCLEFLELRNFICSESNVRVLSLPIVLRFHHYWPICPMVLMYIACHLQRLKVFFLIFVTHSKINYGKIYLSSWFQRFSPLCKKEMVEQSN